MEASAALNRGPTLIASLRKRGLSAVRPLISAKRLLPSGTLGKSATDVMNTTWWFSSASFWNSANSGPPGPAAPVALKNHSVSHISLYVEQETSRRPEERTRAQEPRFDHIRQLGRGALPQHKLFRMVPSHSAERGSASDEDDFALV